MSLYPEAGFHTLVLTNAIPSGLPEGRTDSFADRVFDGRAGQDRMKAWGAAYGAPPARASASWRDGKIDPVRQPTRRDGSRNPGAGRSSSTSRRKRTSRAGRPAAPLVTLSVSSTSPCCATRRRKFCLCSCVPDRASTVRWSWSRVNYGGISSNTTGRYLILPRSRPIAVASTRRWSKAMGTPVGSFGRAGPGLPFASGIRPASNSNS